jgi:hypothetical protein
VKGAETATTPEERAWFEADRRLREKLTIRDIGIWSHYVGDASQPMHVSVHFNGWGDYPNPNGCIAFASGRLSAGAQAVRDLILDAWRSSADAPVGYPMVNMRDIESGKVRVTRELMGAD